MEPQCHWAECKLLLSHLSLTKNWKFLGTKFEPFWELEADFQSGECEWSGRWERRNNVEDKDNPLTKAHRITDLKEKQMLEDLLKSSGDFTTKQEHRDAKENPPLNFDLTSLQREANSFVVVDLKKNLVGRTGII